ncbi:hypothetical protein [Fangia hongkongensis]|uniref:hypothetical protein n=1 Tax=Fangia hongkongensis TaxID=270495 RepID=UPI00037803D4|nr:hypothetical protein [Fangia hongkongensis]MBK2124500.1 hypothetical protein [Fangia hongkongensis]
MKKLFGTSKKKDDAVEADNSAPANVQKTPMSTQKKLVIVGAVLLACILIFELFIIANQQGLRNNQGALQMNIEGQAGAIKNALSDVVQAEAKVVREATDKKVATLQKMILNNHTETVTELQTLKMTLDQLQKKLASVDALNKKLNADLSAEPAESAKKASTNQAQSTSSLSDMISLGKQTSTDYRIYSINNYGLVLQNKNGDFVIATIGKDLPNVGTVTSLTADKVIAGKYQIISNPPGFHLSATLS